MIGLMDGSWVRGGGEAMDERHAVDLGGWRSRQVPRPALPWLPYLPVSTLVLWSKSQHTANSAGAVGTSEAAPTRD